MHFKKVIVVIGAVAAIVVLAVYWRWGRSVTIAISPDGSRRAVSDWMGQWWLLTEHGVKVKLGKLGKPVGNYWTAWIEDGLVITDLESNWPPSSYRRYDGGELVIELRGPPRAVIVNSPSGDALKILRYADVRKTTSAIIMLRRGGVLSETMVVPEGQGDLEAQWITSTHLQVACIDNNDSRVSLTRVVDGITVEVVHRK